jgi:hypothetical protein
VREDRFCVSYLTLEKKSTRTGTDGRCRCFSRCSALKSIGAIARPSLARIAARRRVAVVVAIARAAKTPAPNLTYFEQ